MKVKFRILNSRATMPNKAHASDAGFDLTATSRFTDDRGNIVYGTGIAVEIPEGYVGLLFPRSSVCKYDLSLSNAVGVCDSGFRGEILFKFKPTLRYIGIGLAIVNPTDTYNVGDRIGQIIIMPYPSIEWEEVDELSDSDRGANGYGSSGR